MQICVVRSPGFQRVDLDADHALWVGRLPRSVSAGPDRFEALWGLHPSSYHRIRMGGRTVCTPRWQQAYGADYRYTGQVNRALPVPDALVPFVHYARGAVDARLNGLLLNWYDAALGHYIGRHRDKPTDLVPGAPIVTISLGATRTFRLRPYRRPGKIDLSLAHGAVIVLPFETNRAWTHEVPLFAADQGRRISVTIRAFLRARHETVSPGGAGARSSAPPTGRRGGAPPARPLALGRRRSQGRRPRPSPGPTTRSTF